MSRTERHLRAWPCGCREWVSTTVDGDTIEDEVTERFEPCPEYHNLQTEYERIEVANASVAAALAGPDGIQDDGRLLDLDAAAVKGLSQASLGLRIAVDQSFHALALFLTALILS